MTRRILALMCCVFLVCAAERPAQAASVTQLDITGGAIDLDFGSLGSVSVTFTENGQLVMGQYQPLSAILAPVSIVGHTFSIFTSNQAFPGSLGGAPAPTGWISGSAISVDLRSLFADIAGPSMNEAGLNVGGYANGIFNPVTNAFDLSWNHSFAGYGIPYLESGSFSLQGTAQLAAVPLPATAVLFVTWLAGLGSLARRSASVSKT